MFAPTNQEKLALRQIAFSPEAHDVFTFFEKYEEALLDRARSEQDVRRQLGIFHCYLGVHGALVFLKQLVQEAREMEIDPDQAVAEIFNRKKEA